MFVLTFFDIIDLLVMDELKKPHLLLDAASREEKEGFFVIEQKQDVFLAGETANFEREIIELEFKYNAVNII